ncbi:MAG: START domain-containing protein [Flavobacteriales bacterium]|nr:START domain-containing protein [Flavobacteriales bacterium]
MILIAAIALLTALPTGKGEWSLKKDQDDIKVYTRSVEGSAIAEFKAVTTLNNARLANVLDIVTNVSGFVELFPNCTEATVLEQQGRYNTVHYIRTDVPFPVSDRDGVYEQRTKMDPAGGAATVTILALSDRIPENKKLVRITRASGTWKLTQAGSNVNVIYQFHGEPGGAVPAWMVNSFIVDQPFGTMQNLRKIVAR